MKKGDLVRVSADHPDLGGQVGTFLRYDYARSFSQHESHRMAVISFKKTALNDEWIAPRWLQPAGVFDQLGRLAKDA